MADTSIEKIYIIYYIVYICYIYKFMYIISYILYRFVYCISKYYIYIYIKSISIDQTLALVCIQFLSLSTNDILDQISLCCGGIACALQDI